MLDLTALPAASGPHFWSLECLLGLFVSALPLSEKIIINKAKIGLAVFITLLIAPLVFVAGLWLIMVQLIIGVTVELTLQLAFSAVHFAGEVHGLQMGSRSPNGESFLALARATGLLFSCGLI